VTASEPAPPMSRACALPQDRIGTKIVATLGPASATTARLAALLDAGVNVARINFSHGTRDDHAATLTALRQAADGRREATAIMGDLCGPKIRLGKVTAGGIPMSVGDELRIAPDVTDGSRDAVGINHPEILPDIAIGHRLLVDDGALRFEVVARSGSDLICRCDVGGTLRDHKGVNLPDSDLNLECLTDKDRNDARWAIAEELDYLALSFVRTGDDVRTLRQFLREHDARCHIVSKIETPQAVANIDEIIDASDAILVARGDLGVEMDVAHVPRIQKLVVAACRRAGKPVIVATQMLQSMIDSPTPTRAEVSDVANAIVDGADAVMLSGETAVGQYPVEAVAMMRRIAEDTEAYDQDQRPHVRVNERHPGVTAAVADSINSVVARLAPAAVAVWTEEGVLARLLSRYRLALPLLALTPNEYVRRRLALYYGVFARQRENPHDHTASITAVDEVIIPEGWAVPGNLVVVGLGPRSLEEGDTGALAVRIIGARQP
jgi:pyruvate kinase